MVNPESPPPPVEPEVKDARRTHCTHTLRRTTTPRQQRVHPHHRPLVRTTTCSRRQIGGPDHAGLWPSKPARPTTTAHLSPSWPVLPTQARGRLRIRARAILDCMCCDVPQSTPHASAGNACRWARRCGLVMESLTHETADPSPSSTRTTTLCAPPASRIFDSIGIPLSVSQSITCSGNPASSIPTSLSTRWWAITDDGLGANGSTPSRATIWRAEPPPKPSVWAMVSTSSAVPSRPRYGAMPP